MMLQAERSEEGPNVIRRGESLVITPAGCQVKPCVGIQAYSLHPHALIL